jgi:hypothetical protein
MYNGAIEIIASALSRQEHDERNSAYADKAVADSVVGTRWKVNIFFDQTFILFSLGI